MALSSPGIGSNLDVNGIVNQLMAVERRPLDSLGRREAGFQAQLTAFGSFRGALSSFQTAVRGLASASKYETVNATSSDSSVLSAAAATGTTPGAYSVEVSKLAQAQRLAASGQASQTAAIGAGGATTLTFDFGTIGAGTFDAATGKYAGATFTANSAKPSKSITIDSSNNSLQGIRDAINGANLGVTAAIVNDGSGTPYRLTLSVADTGAASSLRIGVAGDPALQALLAQNPADDAGQNWSETSTAQNAALKVNGIAVTRATNSVSDAVPGVTLTLAKTNVGSPVTLTVARDTAGVKSAVDSFVKAYNDLNKTLSDLSGFNAATKKAGPLQGESSVRTVQGAMRALLGSPLSGVTSGFATLGKIGIAFQKDGSLAVDSAKLQRAIDSNFADIAGLFAAVGRSSDADIIYAGATSATAPGAYGVNITTLASQGRLAGSAPAALAITAGVNDQLDITVDGVAASVTLAPGTYGNAAELAGALQSRINGASALTAAGAGVTVTETGGVLTMTSNRYGSASKVAIVGGSAATALFGAGPVATGGVDVAGTLGGSPAVGTGQTLAGGTGQSAEGLKVTVSGAGTGDRGTVNYSQGYAYRLDRLIDDLLGPKGVLGSRADGVNRLIKGLDNQRDAITRRLADVEKNYRRQFTALDTAISRMSQTSTFLTQQLAALTKNNSTN